MSAAAQAETAWWPDPATSDVRWYRFARLPTSEQPRLDECPGWTWPSPCGSIPVHQHTGVGRYRATLASPQA